ncbi:MAG: DUF4401 domain-containing protein [Steroidobacteraceae bacterium]|nr:DUF4401 domain-containing protein [Steroidobacteraceae bacterium]
MNPRVTELVDALRARGVIAADAPALTGEPQDRPWFIALLQGVAGWLGGIFLLVFLGAMLRPESAVSMAACGIVLLLGAWGMYFADRNAVFLDQFALAMSIAGQFALAWAIVKDADSGVFIAATLFVLQCAVFAVMPNKFARLLAAFFACAAWVYTIRFLLRPGAGDGLIFDDELIWRSSLAGGYVVPLGWLLTWVPMIALVAWLVKRESRWMSSRVRTFARPALSGLLLGLSAAGIVTEPLGIFLLGEEQLGLAVGWWSLFPLLSIVLAVFAMVCAYQVRSAGIVGVAILAALVHLSRFYYLYGTTLLWKSLIMVAVGAALLGAGFALAKRARGTA